MTQVNPSPAEAVVLAVFLDSPSASLTIPLITRTTGLSESTVRAQIKRLRLHGVVWKSSLTMHPAYYRLRRDPNLDYIASLRRVGADVRDVERI